MSMFDHFPSRIKQRESSSKENAGKRETRCREYPFSSHDNRASLQNSIEAFDHGLGRKKFVGETRQHNSHFCLRSDGMDDWNEDLSAYQTDYQGCQGTEGTHSKRFPRNHLERSRAAAAKAGGGCMWFGRHDSKDCTPLSVLAATNCPFRQSPGITPDTAAVHAANKL